MSYPECIGMYDENKVECRECRFRGLCKSLVEKVEADVYRKGTHQRIVSKFKEKKFKPKRVPIS